MKVGCTVIAWGLCLGAVIGAAPTGRPAGRSIDFGHAEEEQVSTNRAEATGQRDMERRAEALKRVEQDLRAPMDIFSFASPADNHQLPLSSIQRFLARPVVRPSGKGSEKNKNWIMESPEEMLLDTPDSEGLKLSTGADDPAKRARDEDFYLKRLGVKLGDEGSLRSDPSIPERWSAGLEDPRRDQGGSPEHVQATERALRRAINSSLSDDFMAAPPSHQGFADIFHTGGEQSDDSRRQMLQHQQMMREYREAIGAPANPWQDQAGGRSAVAVVPPPGATAGNEGLAAHPFRSEASDPAFGRLRPLLPGAVSGADGYSAMPAPTAADLHPKPVDRSPPKQDFVAPRRPFM